MKNHSGIIITALLFLGALVLGQMYVNYSSLGYTEAAIIWLSAVLAGGFFWHGSRR